MSLRTLRSALLWGSALPALVAVMSQSAQAQDVEGDTPEVTVTGVRPHPTRSSSSPELSHSTLDQVRLNQPGITLSQALREAPGVQVTQSGGLGAPATARLRGATAAQTPVYLGRLRINDEVGGVANLSTVPSFLIQRVEIFRSHTPGQLTQLGIGGALLLVPRRPLESESAVQGEVGSFGLRTLRGRHAFVGERRNVLVTGEVFGADNDYAFTDTRGTLFVDDDGGRVRLPNADAQGGSFWLSATEKLGPTQVELVLHHAQLDQGAPKLALVPTEQARARFTRSLASVSATTPTSWGQWYASTRAVLGTTTLDDPARELGLVAVETRTPGARVEQVLELTHRPADDWWVGLQVSASAERLEREETRERESVQQLAARRVLVRPALSTNYTTPFGVSLGGVVASPCVSTAVDTLSLCDNVEPTGRLHARWTHRQLEVFASWGRAQRLATLSELYGVSLLVRGNDQLTPEIAQTAEAGGRLQIPRKRGPAWAWFDVAGFVRHTRDLIVYLRSPQGYLRPKNRDRARTIGGEFTAGVEPLIGLTLEGNLSLLDPRDTSPERVVENNVLPFLSRAVANARISYRHDFGDAWFNAARASFHYFYQSNRYADPAGLGVIPAQSFGDVELGVEALQRHLDARLRLSNIWNEQRFDVVGFPLPPRSIFGSIEVRW